MIWQILLAIGMAQGVFLGCALLLLKTRNRSATRLLALLVWTFTWSIAEEWIDRAGLYPRLPHAIGMAILGELAMGPLFLLFARAVAQRPTPWPRGWLHFSPLLLAIAVGLPFYLGSAEAKLAFLDGPRPDWMVPFVLAKAIYLLSYIAWSQATLASASAPGEPPSQAHGARWLRRWYLAFGAAALLIYAASFLHFAGLSFGPDPDSLSGLILAGFLYVVATLVIFRRDLLEAAAPRPVLPQGKRAFVAAELDRRMKEERLFLDPDLNLGKLGQCLGVSEHHLSEVINRELGTTFYQYLHRFRLEAVAASLADPAHSRATVLDLAFAAGFKSKATFYRLFAEHFGQSPTAFRKERAQGRVSLG